VSNKKVKLAVLAVILLGAGFLIWVRVMLNRSTEASRNIWSFERALRYYVVDHHGDLPSNMEELLAGYGVKMPNGDWEVPSRTDIDMQPSSEFLILREPSWFDVEWGARADQIGPNGEIIGTRRMAVRASSEAPFDFGGYCNIPNRSVGFTVAEIRKNASTTMPGD